VQSGRVTRYGETGSGTSASFQANPPGHVIKVTIGTSIFLIALGAILAFAVNATVAGPSIAGGPDPASGPRVVNRKDGE
jgi:hypothetical protein